MSTKFNYIEASKINWEGIFEDDRDFPGIQIISMSCLQRIAAATEAMAKNYVALLENVEHLRKVYKDLQWTSARQQRSITAHKANYTRLKNKLHQYENDNPTKAAN